MNDEEIYARLGASPGRRAIGLGVLTALTLILLRLALAGPGGPLAWRLVLVAMAAAAAAAVWAMYRATALELRLTETRLTDSQGQVLAELDQIVSVDRGTFAFKPSNGFLLRLASPAPRLWRPGLYWRIGRRLGVGGIVNAAQARAMADTLALLLAERAAAETAAAATTKDKD
ncbi:MAG: hypothetical protein P1U48_15690 [Pseudooceanicola sp.]|nr:hypothetical protein [Pseudooceanicola sp.]